MLVREIVSGVSVLLETHRGVPSVVDPSRETGDMKLNVQFLGSPSSKQCLHSVVEYPDEHLQGFGHDLPIAICELFRRQLLQLPSKNKMRNR